MPNKQSLGDLEIMSDDYFRVSGGDLTYKPRPLTKFEQGVLRMFSVVGSEYCDNYADIFTKKLIEKMGMVEKGYLIEKLDNIIGFSEKKNVQDREIDKFIKDVDYFIGLQELNKVNVIQKMRNEKDTIVSGLAKTYGRGVDWEKYYYSMSDFKLLRQTLKILDANISEELSNRKNFFDEKVSKDEQYFTSMLKEMDKLEKEGKFYSTQKDLIDYYTYKGDRILNAFGRGKYVTVPDPKTGYEYTIPKKLLLQTVLSFKKFKELYQKPENKIKQATTVYRGLSLVQLVNNMLHIPKNQIPPELVPNNEGKTILNDKTADMVGKFLLGKTLMDNGILSTSLDESVADEYAADHDDGSGAKLVINLPAGSEYIDAREDTHFVMENEYILKPRTKFKVKKVMYKNIPWPIGGVIILEVARI